MEEYKIWDIIFLGLKILGILLIISLFLAPIFISDFGGSNGYHTGYITAIEERNTLIFDSTIVYLKTDTESTQEDVYCVNDVKVKNILKTASRERKLVTIHYENDYFLMRNDCNGGESIIMEVEIKN